jgi:hypothetical protein
MIKKGGTLRIATGGRVVNEEFPGLMVIITHDEKVLSSSPCYLSGLMACTHEEEDTGMFVGLHAADRSEHGMKKILLKPVTRMS